MRRPGVDRPLPDSFAIFSAARQRSSSRPRTIGYFSRLALYRYQEYDAPRAQPRGSWLGRSARVRG